MKKFTWMHCSRAQKNFLFNFNHHIYLSQYTNWMHRWWKRKKKLERKKLCSALEFGVGNRWISTLSMTNSFWVLYYIQVYLCQKLLFLHQLTQNMTIERWVQYMKIPSSNLERTCFVQKLFLTFRTIFVHNMFSPCSAKLSKRRATDKDLPVQYNTRT